MAFIHRFGSTLNDHLHFHCVVIDGVFTPDPARGVTFHAATGFDERAIAQVQDQVRRRLHEGIITSAHNIYLQRMMSVLSDALDLLGTTTYSVPGRIASGWKENTEIVECVARRDPAAAEDAARRHIRAAGAVRIAMTPKD